MIDTPGLQFERRLLIVAPVGKDAALVASMLRRYGIDCVTCAGLEPMLAALLEQVMGCAHECVRRAGLGAAQLDAIYLTGGSSALRPFQAALRRSFPGSALVEGDLFGGVASGLAYAGQRG